VLLCTRRRGGHIVLPVGGHDLGLEQGPRAEIGTHPQDAPSRDDRHYIRAAAPRQRRVRHWTPRAGADVVCEGAWLPAQCLGIAYFAVLSAREPAP
jgi:hypothetical protein